MRVIFILILTASISKAAERLALPFDLSKNGIQVLPGKVRYELYPNGEIKIADVILKNETFNMTVQDQKFVFTWPNGLFEHPRLQLRLGTDVLLQSTYSDSESPPDQLTQSLSIEKPSINAEGKSFRFCVDDAVATPSAKICSELYDLQEDVAQLNGKKYVTRALVNGKKVAYHGTVSVTPGEPSLKIQLAGNTGFYFESELKIENREFVDIQLLKGKRYRIEYLLTSALPNSKPDVLIVEVDDPKATVKEPGQVAMVVGFIVKDIVPREKDKVFFADENIFSTYSSIVRVRLQKNSKKTKLIPVDGTIKTLQEKEVEWQIKNLENDETRRAYLSVERNKRQLMTYAQITRYRAMEIGMDLGSMSSSGQGAAQSGSEMLTLLRFSWWIDDLFRIRVPWFSWQRWGYEFQLNRALVSPEPAKMQRINSTAKYRFKQGIHLVEPTYGAKAVLQLMSESDISASTIGLGLFAELRSPKWLMQLTDWMLVCPQWVLLDFQFFPLTIDKSLKTDQIWSLTARYKYLISKSFDADLSLNYQVDKFKVGRDKTYDSNLLLAMIGISAHF